MSYAEIVFATVPAAPPTRKNQRATSCPAPISAKVPYFAASRLMRSALSCVLGEGARGTSGPFGGDGGFTAQPARLSVALFSSRQASSSSQDLTNAAAPSRWRSAARASRSMPARVNRWRVSSMLRPASCSRWVAFMLPPSGAAASAARAVPPADLRRQRRGLWGAPAGGLVLVHGRRRAENGLDDRPRRFDGVLPREERRVARHRIAEEPLVGLHLLPIRVVDHVQLRRLGDHLLSRPLHAGAAGDLHLRTQLEEEVVRNCSSVQSDLATPTTGTSRCPRRAMASRAGKIFL